MVYNLNEVQKEIDKNINSLISQLSGAPRELYEPILYILSLGGKRMRPVLVLLSCNLFSNNIQQAVKPALALEIFHNFTLLHDDIMDKSPIRRGMPTVHQKWNDNVAILSGDAMSILSYQILAQSDTTLLPKILEVFNKTALEVCEGQQFDMNFEKSEEITVDDYLQMISLKTSVLLAACMKIGAICGGAKDSDANLLYDFGKNLGLAFQLKDDFLDTFGQTDTFGKKVGNDIVTNKKTFLYLTALEKAKPDTKKILIEAYKQESTSSTEKVEKITNIFLELGIKEECLRKINHYNQLAINSLEKVLVDSSRKKELFSIAENLLHREK